MRQFSYVLTNQDGLCAKPIGKLKREASRFSSKVRLRSGERSAALGEANAVLGLNMQCGNRITVTVEGHDEEAAIAALQNYFVSNL